MRSKTPPARPSGALEIAGLFAGIGGFELGLTGAGLATGMLCEIDIAAREVLEERFPGVRLASDVRKIKSLPKSIDVIVAGFPCQDLSQAGRTAGIAGSQSSLVGNVFRLLEKRRVPWLVLENVPFMLQLGKGRALELILEELERLHYRWAYRVVDTLAFGLPQRRRRVFLVASRVADPRDVILADDYGEPVPKPVSSGSAFGFYWTEGIRGLGWAIDAVPTLKGGSTIGIPSPPAIVLPSGQVVTPDIRDAERMQGFPADWTTPAERVARSGYRWKLVGNAVTVNVAAWLGRRLISPGEYEPRLDLPLPGGAAWPKAAWNLGKGRFASPVSAWPFGRIGVPIADFLEFDPKPLSERATAGFLSRTKAAKLRFPKGFLGAVEMHLERVRRGSSSSAATAIA